MKELFLRKKIIEAFRFGRGRRLVAARYKFSQFNDFRHYLGLGQIRGGLH